MELVIDQEERVTICPWCHGSRHCAKCDGAGQRVVKSRVLRRTQATDCRACEGTGTCQLCKVSGQGAVT